MYTAVSVCTTKLTRLTSKKHAAYVYLFFVVNLADSSKSRAWK